MAAVTATYSIKPCCRTARQITGMDESSEKTGTRDPKPYNKKLHASVDNNSEEVIDEMFKSALKQDPGNKRPWVILVDAQRSQLAYIKKAIKRYSIDAVIVVDFIHVLEYLWSAAYCFQDEKSEEAEK